MKKTKDLHVYLTPEDQRAFEKVKKIMASRGIIGVKAQMVVRYCIHCLAQSETVK